MRTVNIHIPRVGNLRIRRNGRAIVATVADWQACGCLATLAYGLPLALISELFNL